MSDRIKIRTSVLSPAANADQGYVFSSSISTTSPIEFGNKAATSESAFIRFPDVFIPHTAVIVSAKLKFIAASAQTATDCMVNIYGSAEDNAAAPTGSADYAAKPVTTSVTSWAGVDSFNKANNIEYASPELKSIIQEIISRPKWAQGNAILLLIKDNSSSSGAYRNF